MTAQAHELLIIEGVETSMTFCPPLPKSHPRLEQLSIEEARKQENLPWIVFSTACWRQYIGTWELKDEKLYLRDIKGRYRMKGSPPIFADWVTAVLRIPDGDVLRYVHMGFESVYEFDNLIKIEKGVVTDERRIDNREKDVNGHELGKENLSDNENNFDGDDL